MLLEEIDLHFQKYFSTVLQVRFSSVLAFVYLCMKMTPSLAL